MNPAVTIGRNRFVAWGETNVMADVRRGLWVPPRRSDPTPEVEVREGAPLMTNARHMRGSAWLNFNRLIAEHKRAALDFARRAGF